jgi:hypothetical protein
VITGTAETSSRIAALAIKQPQRACRELVAKSGELTVDAPIPPGRVLGRQSMVSRAPTAALPPLGVALPQLLELAAVLRLAGLLFDLLDELLAPWASREVPDELAD